MTARGNPTRRTEAAGLPESRITEWTYDSVGQVLTETVRGGSVALPDDSTVTVLDATTTHEYDLRGNRITVTDAEGNVTRFAPNRLAQSIEMTDPRGNRWRTAFDVRGLPLARTNPLGQTTIQSFNKLGERLTRTDPLGRIWRYAYDPRGRLIATTDPLLNTARTTYDAAGRVIEETDFAGQLTRRASYDADGRPRTQEDALGNQVEFLYGDPNATGTANTGDLPIAVSYPTFIQPAVADPVPGQSVHRPARLRLAAGTARGGRRRDRRAEQLPGRHPGAFAARGPAAGRAAHGAAADQGPAPRR